MARGLPSVGATKPWLKRQEKVRAKVGKGTSPDAAFGKPKAKSLPETHVMSSVKKHLMPNLGPVHSPSEPRYPAPKRALGFKNPLS